MTIKYLKMLSAVLATVSAMGVAVAQSNPPTTSNPNQATGAGQQSSQSTSMGSTGTQGNQGAAIEPNSAASSEKRSTTSDSSSTPSTSGNSTGSPQGRAPRADRN